MPLVLYTESEAKCTTHDVRRGESAMVSNHLSCSIGAKMGTDAPVLADVPSESHTGPDVADWFRRQMIDIDWRLMEYLFDIQRLLMTRNEERNIATAVECYVYPRPLNKNNVRDHDHLTGKYRCEAHEARKLILRKSGQVALHLPHLQQVQLAPDHLRTPLIPWHRHHTHRPRNAEVADNVLG